MKRFLLLFCAAVLACSIMIVPAFAADDLTFTVDILNSEEPIHLGVPLDGLYSINFYDANNQIVFSLPAKDFTFPITVFYTETLSDDGNEGWELRFYYEDNDLMVNTEFWGCADDMCGDFSFFFPNVVSFELLPVSAPMPDPEPVSPISGIFGVFTGVGSWLAGQLGTTTSLFWNGQGLTFLGVLSVSGLALAVVLLLVMVIVRFLRFRG